MNRLYDSLGFLGAALFALGLVFLVLATAGEIIEANAERAREARAWDAVK